MNCHMYMYSYICEIVSTLSTRSQVDEGRSMQQKPLEPQAIPKEYDSSLPEELDFVERPSVDFFCPMTFEFLLDPHLTACCGHHSSQKAVTTLKSEGKPCHRPFAWSLTWPQCWTVSTDAECMQFKFTVPIFLGGVSGWRGGGAESAHTDLSCT